MKDNKVREIEFRGKDIKTKEWHYGSLVSKYDVDACLYCQYHILEKSEYSRSCDWDSDLVNVDFYEVDENTLGQFTGERDKNGNKIYEGDILLVIPKEKSMDGKNHYDYVIFSNGCFCLTNAVIFYEFTYGVDNYEVVGNIYDNPELLGGSDEECDN